MIMKVEDKGTVMYCGTVSEVSFNETKDSAVIRFLNTDMTYEFRNGKRKRADAVKKMRLHEGEEIIVIGAKSESSPLCVFGYELKRKGIVKGKSLCMVKGSVVEQDDDTVLINNGKKDIAVECSFPIMKKDIAVTCIITNDKYIAIDAV